MLERIATEERLMLAARFEGYQRAVRVVRRCGTPADPATAERFSNAVFAGLQTNKQSGYVVAFGLGAPACKVDYIACVRDRLTTIERHFSAEAAEFGFESIDALLQVFAEDLPAAPLKSVDVRLSEGRVFVDGSEVALTKRERQILTIIALSRRPIPSDHLADMVWPDADPWKSRATLKVFVHRLRARLGRYDAIVTGSGTLAIGPDVRVDLLEWSEYIRALPRGALKGDTRIAVTDILNKISGYEDTPSNAVYTEPILASSLAALAERAAARIAAHYPF
jgi:hypothetical protein